MKYFLIVFDRSGHRIVELEEFSDSREAVRARFEREKDPHSRGYEVVVLGAKSREALENTHSRYFGTGRELSTA